MIRYFWRKKATAATARATVQAQAEADCQARADLDAARANFKTQLTALEAALRKKEDEGMQA